jgi:FkbM family methyltransferase
MVTGLSPWYSGAERAQQRVFKLLLRQGDVVVDVGANWGLHTLYFSRLVGPTGQVLAFEPYLPVFAELQWHLQANSCHNSEAFPVALGDTVGTELFQPGENASTGRLTRDPLGHDVPGTALTVSLQTLDTIDEQRRIERLALVKIDAEGAEARVLEGAARLTERTRPSFVIELHSPEQDVAVARWLAERGYRLERVTGPPIRHTECGWPDPDGVWGTIVARPR